MKRMVPGAVLVAALALLVSCGASVTVVGPRSEGVQLRQFKRLYLVTASVAGASSAEVGAIGGLVAASAKDGNAQIAVAAERLAHQLRRIGFDVVGNRESADAVAEFSIGTVRYDLLTGWIADEASLVIRSAGDDEVVASVFGDARWITPTVKTLVNRLADGVRRLY